MAGGLASCSSYSSSSAALCSSSDLKRRYDVFISFRGEDTRRNFTSHLYAALEQNQTQAFKDDTTLEKGNEVWPALVHAIDDSYLCIVIFSKHYASSTWCLRELTHILKSKKEGEVIPVFYGVDPSHVRKQAGSYKKAFQKHEKDCKLDQETLKKWRASLDKAASFCGYDSESKDYGDENQLIQTIVKDILQKLESIYPKSEAQGLVGIDENCGHIEALFKKFQVIGLWGMSGIGKTTLARYVFNKYKSQYEGHCFLANIRERTGKLGYDLCELHKELFSKLLKGKCSHIDKIRLNCMNVLVVLDDVATMKQIEYLVGESNCFGPHSRIIITSRNKHVLSKGVDEVYKVKELSFQDSLQLFSLKAFGKDHPEIGFKDLSKKAIIYAQGIPLALEILGSFLYGRSKKVWESELNKLKQHPHDIIQDALRLSYDGLDDEVKNIFLDIAFFFKGHKKGEVEMFLEDDYLGAISGMAILFDKAFITIDSDGDTVEMHGLIQKFGWNIVRQECKDPRGRSQLRDPKEIYDALKNNEGNDLVEGMTLDMSQVEDLHLNCDIFKKMTKLRLLKFNSQNLWCGRACKLYLPSDFELFSNNSRKCRRLAYGEYLSSIPCFKMHAGERYIPDIHVRKLEEEVQDLQNLVNWKRMDPRRCKGSTEIIPNLSHGVSNPEWVRRGFKNLCHVHPAILCIHMVVKTDISWCIKPKNPQDEIHSISLRKPLFQGCSSVKQFSLTSVERRDLNITDTMLKILPSSGECFINSEELFLPDLFKNFFNECWQRRSPEELQMITIRRLDARNLRHVHDAFRSIEGSLFCESCELSQTSKRKPWDWDWDWHNLDQISAPLSKLTESSMGEQKNKYPVDNSDAFRSVEGSLFYESCESSETSKWKPWDWDWDWHNLDQLSAPLSKLTESSMGEQKNKYSVDNSDAFRSIEGSLLYESCELFQTSKRELWKSDWDWDWDFDQLSAPWSELIKSSMGEQKNKYSVDNSDAFRSIEGSLFYESCELFQTSKQELWKSDWDLDQLSAPLSKLTESSMGEQKNKYVVDNSDAFQSIEGSLFYESCELFQTSKRELWKSDWDWDWDLDQLLAHGVNGSFQIS